MMNISVKKQINLVIKAVIGVALVLVGFFLIINAPAFYNRIKYQATKPANTNVAVTNIVSTGYDWWINESNFPDIFVAEQDKKLVNEYSKDYRDNFLIIPNLDISVPIVFLDSIDENSINEKLKSGIGLYPGTARPGERGNSFMFGHSSYPWWDWSEYGSVFANLEEIQVNDLIVVYYNHKTILYRVKGTQVVTPQEVSVLNQGESFELSLMTCTPLGTDINRFIVSAELVN